MFSISYSVVHRDVMQNTSFLADGLSVNQFLENTTADSLAHNADSRNATLLIPVKLMHHAFNSNLKRPFVPEMVTAPLMTLQFDDGTTYDVSENDVNVNKHTATMCFSIDDRFRVLLGEIDWKSPEKLSK